MIVYVVIVFYGNDAKVDSVYDSKLGAQSKCNELNASGVSATYYTREVES